MKINLFLCILICSILICPHSKAASISGWDIPAIYLTGGKVLINNTGTTNISVNVYLGRYSQETGIYMQFALGTKRSNGDIILLSGLQTITESDFDAYSPGSTFLINTFSVNVNPALVENNTLYLIWYPCCNLPSAFSGSYQTTPNTYVPPPLPGSFSYGSTALLNSAYYNRGFDYLNTTHTNIAGTRIDNVLGTKIDMSNNQPVLVTGGSIYSPNHTFRLTLQTDGNLVLYQRNSNGSETPTWASNTNGSASASLYFQNDANLVIYSNNNTPLNPGSAIWASGLYNPGGFYSDLSNLNNMPHYLLQDDGNFVLYWPTHLATYNGSGGPNSVQYTTSEIIIFAATDTSYPNASPHFGSLYANLWPGVGLLYGADTRGNPKLEN